MNVCGRGCDVPAFRLGDVMIRLLLMFALGTQCVPAIAADTGGAAQSITDSGLNLTGGQFAGMVTNQAMTVAGQDFYQYFSALWYDKPLAEQFSLAVRERPSARQGNQVQIDFAGRTRCSRRCCRPRAAMCAR
jgi:hypothetical protein